MSDLNQACNDLIGKVTDAVGASVVDLNTGLLLGVAHSVPYFTQSYLDAVAAAAVDMFRGRTISTVEELMTNQRGKDSSRSIKEIQMTTDGTYHFMTVLPEKPDYLLVLITTRKANLGMGWSAIKTAIPDIQAKCP